MAKSTTTYVEVKEQGWWRWVFVVLAAALFLAMPLMSLDAGNSGDEDAWQHPQSEHLYKYYTTFGKDTSYINKMQLEYSGYAFDAATMFVIKVFNAEDYMTVRHVINALMGALLMLFVGLLARLIGGWRAGCIALLLIFFSPHIVGQSFNNPKDIPFAALLMGAVYYIAWFIKEFPNPTWKTVVKLGVMIGATVGIRPGGFLLIPYFGFFVMVYYMLVNKPKNYFSQANQQVIKRVLMRACVALGVMLVVMFILWPYALKDPRNNIVSSFKLASHFEAVLRLLYEGKMIWSDSLPWYYTLKSMFITSPIAVFVGVVVYIFTARKFEKGRFWLFLLLFCFIFPIFWVAYSKANVYGGWRHSLFAYPTLVVIAALGFNSLIVLFDKKKYLNIALTALPLVLLANPIAFTLKNHPYEYLFFNKLAGGTKGAYGSYELDYYYHSTREASEWILADVKKNGAPDSTRKTRVVSWHSSSVEYFFRKDTADFWVGFSRWYERGYNDWDYAVFTITGMNPELLKNKKAFPPKNTAYQIKVDGVPICIVLKREDKSDFFGHRAMQQGSIGEAVPMLQKALAYDEYNEQALNDLISIYSHVGMLDSAQMLAQRWVAFNRGNTTALNLLANIYLAKGDYSSASVTANAIIKYNSRDISGLWIIANAQAQQGQFNDALRTLQQLLRVRGDFKPAYQLMAQIYDRAGDRQRAQQIMNAISNMP